VPVQPAALRLLADLSPVLARWEEALGNSHLVHVFESIVRPGTDTRLIQR
jgi:hypothetical protein